MSDIRLERLRRQRAADDQRQGQHVRLGETGATGRIAVLSTVLGIGLVAILDDQGRDTGRHAVFDPRRVPGFVVEA